MFHSVLVPLDGTTFGERSLPLARMVASDPGTRLHLVSVNADQDDYLTRIADGLRSSRIDVDQANVGGEIVEALEHYAKEVGADLIVMATHGRSGIERLRLGSVAEGLVTSGVAPVLLFHSGSEDPAESRGTIDRVVIALDRTAYSQLIVDPVETLGSAAGVSGYTIVHVTDKTGVGKAGWTPTSVAQARVNEDLAPVRERLGAGGAQVDVHVVMASDPTDGILRVATDVGADLIALATHGMTGLRPTLTGSVASQVLRKWHGSLLLRRSVA